MQPEYVDRRFYENEDVDRRYYEGSYKEEEEDYAPKPFSYEYGGADHDGRHFAKTESKDEDGVVKGWHFLEIHSVMEIAHLISNDTKKFILTHNW